MNAMQKSLTFAEAEAIYRAVGAEVESGAVLALSVAYIDLYHNAYTAAHDRLAEYAIPPRRRRQGRRKSRPIHCGY